MATLNPTTASRMDAYSPLLIERGPRGMVGKGLRSQAARDSMTSHGCVYFGAVEGTSALLSRFVKEVELIAYEDLGAEAIQRLAVERLSVTVVDGLYGDNLYREGRERWRGYLVALGRITFSPRRANRGAGGGR